MEDSLIQPNLDGVAHVVVSNAGGGTQLLQEDHVLGEACSAEVVDSPGEPTSDLVVSTVYTQEDSSRRQEKLREHIDIERKDVSEEERRELMELLLDYHSAFSLDEDERGETDLVQFEINTGEARPKKYPLRRMPFAVREEVACQVTKMLKAGVIAPSKSPWSSPVVLVRKKDQTHRFCVDYRGLNSVTKVDTFPLPRIDDLLDQLGQCQYFSTLDLAAGYWQIRVHPESREKTAFSTHQGLFEFQVMPFGLTNAPAVFQRLIQQVLMGLNPDSGPDFVAAYIDDIIIFSVDLEQHLHHIQLVLQRIIDTGLKLQPKKCHFMRSEVEYLGHVITPSGLKTNPKLVAAVDEFPVPTNLRELRRFVGMCSYYRRFIPQFSTLARPLHDLTRKEATFEWTADCEQSFQSLKKKLVEAPVLAYPSFQKPFILETDASGIGLGAVLSQPQPDQKSHPIAYASRSLSASERNYSITELETLAVVWAISHFHAYLYGHEVTVFTDNSAVRAVLETSNPTGKYARWWNQVYASGIQSIKILHKSGKSNVNADALSRSPVSTKSLAVEEPSQVASIRSESTADLADLLQMDPEVSSRPSSDFGMEQRQDPFIRDLVTFLEKDELPADPVKAKKLALQGTQFVIIDGVVYFTEGKKGSRKRAVVPSHLQLQMMKESHGGSLAGHFAGRCLYDMLARHWWWERMFSDVVEYCRSCTSCAIASGLGRPSKPTLAPIPVQRPFQIIGVDVMELPVTKRGNRYAIVFQDMFSKWPMVYPAPDQKSLRLVKLLVEEIVPVFGVPEALLSDRGTNLLSHLMLDVCRLLGVKKLNTTAYHPQCDGMVERFNRTLKSMIRKHVAVLGAQWDQYLSGLLWAYRNTPHDSTGEKPSFLLFGMDCRSPTEAVLLPPSTFEAMDVGDYREELIRSLSSARKIAQTVLQQAQQQYKGSYDRHAHPIRYQLGDWIMLKFPHEETGRSRKISRPWHGPYRVVQQDDTDVVAAKVYFPGEGTIRVHQTRTTLCPPAFQNGFYWYGQKQSSIGRYPRWIDGLDAPELELENPLHEDISTSASCEGGLEAVFPVLSPAAEDDSAGIDVCAPEQIRVDSEVNDIADADCREDTSSDATDSQSTFGLEGDAVAQERDRPSSTRYSLRTSIKTPKRYL